MINTINVLDLVDIYIYIWIDQSTDHYYEKKFEKEKEKTPDLKFGRETKTVCERTLIICKKEEI